jgi:hypothetical protein
MKRIEGGKAPTHGKTRITGIELCTYLKGSKRANNARQVNNGTGSSLLVLLLQRTCGHIVYRIQDFSRV